MGTKKVTERADVNGNTVPLTGVGIPLLAITSAIARYFYSLFTFSYSHFTAI